MATSHFLTFFLLSHFTAFASAQVFSSSIASDQIKFWSENVNNQMPQSISTKLSPLTKGDRDRYTKMISKNDFSATPSFCSLAKLSCSSEFADFLGNDGTAKVYQIANSQKPALPSQSNPGDKGSFFRISILTEGNIFNLSDLEEKIPSRAFLPKEIASKISLSRNNIRKIFPKSYELSKNSIEKTLYYCNAEAIDGEMKSCPKSIEEMISFSKFALGKNKLLSLASQGTRTGDFLIKKSKKYDRQKIVACHEVYLPFAAYFCHSIPSSRIYAVDLVEPETQLPVSTVIAICHMDTSAWEADHVAFQILKFAPGEGEACHWMSNVDLAWIADD